MGLFIDKDPRLFIQRPKVIFINKDPLFLFKDIEKLIFVVYDRAHIYPSV